ncbi:MAG TPA: hypothetical protein VHB27_04465 [Rhodopila sp.]|uniref:hypothetical protein n=1 Tax=Rhodopila sp. TaxID=2480087 RepID=UPI002CD3185E|nr:hypothetical protein [Rhodopila sp.]HVY14457.1 hypothetical protein [Rhodopila sp.]
MSVPRARIKSGKASLIGGIVVGIATFCLWVVIARDVGADTPAWIAAGAVVAIAVGGWIRLADL